MKKSELIFNLVSIPTDIVALAAAGAAAFYLRTPAQRLVGPILYELRIFEFALVMAKIIPVLLIVFALLGLYNLRGVRRFVHEFNRIVVGSSLGVIGAIVLFFFNQSIFPSRFIILVAWILSVVFVLLGRLILKTIQEALFTRGYGLHRLVIINGYGMEAEVIQNMLKDRSYGYQIVAEFDNSPQVIDHLDVLFRKERFDEIIQANPHVSDDENLKLVEFARNHGLQFSFVPNLFEVQRNVIELNNFRGVPVISLKNSPLDGWGRVAKRIFDVVASALLLLASSPVFLLAAVAIKLDSPGPVFYAAQRGSRTKEFWFYKFRSMHTHLSVGEGYGGEEAERLWNEMRKQHNDRGGEDAVLTKFKNDPRVTRIGRFLRKTKLDELPQLWNVLKGDISMVGPRPHILPELNQYKDKYPRILSIKTGVFGLAQLAIITWPVLPFEEEMRLNMYYIENWSLWWDVKILIKTIYFLLFVPKPHDDY